VGPTLVEPRQSALMHDLDHELSTPLTPIAGYLKILQSERLGPLSAQQRKVLDSTAAAAGKLARIVENLADFANLEAGHAAIAPAPVDPDALAREVVDELKDAARDARVHLDLRTSGRGPLLADRRKLRQALFNVVQNAVKFSPHGGEVLLEVEQDGERLRFTVYDQGPGVSAPRQARIFEPFQHADRREEARPPGSGLGLPVARRIAEAHGGRIALESPPHVQPVPPTHHFSGAKFVIEIPAVPAAPAPERQPSNGSG
jgi:signal transduction histidine kinase